MLSPCIALAFADVFLVVLLQADNMASSSITTGTIGFPRIGPNREMKKALERYTSFVLFKATSDLS